MEFIVMLKLSTILGWADNASINSSTAKHPQRNEGLREKRHKNEPLLRQYNSFKFKQLPGSEHFYILAEERTSQYIIEGKHKAVFRRSTMASSMAIDSESQGSIEFELGNDVPERPTTSNH